MTFEKFQEQMQDAQTRMNEDEFSHYLSEFWTYFHLLIFYERKCNA